MDPNAITSENYERLLDAIIPIMTSRGLKATTMDYVASTLGMSKRTLYEIFDSKEEMLKQAIVFHHKRTIKKIIRIFKTAPTVMEALFDAFVMQRDLMKGISPLFFQDMDTTYAHLQPTYKSSSKEWMNNLLEVIQEGIRQEVFLSDVNYPILLKMLAVQMESLKRMEEFLPSDITIVDALDTVMISFLRSIASPKGSQLLEKIRKADLERKEITQKYNY